MRRATTRVDVMPYLPVVFGLGEPEAAAAIGVSASKFRALVKDWAHAVAPPHRWSHHLGC